MVLEGTQLFMKGSELMRQGILYYRNNGLKLKDLEKDLRAKGWEGAYSSLGYHQSNLRKEGLLAEATQGARADLKGTNKVKYKSYREDHVTGLECDKRNLEEQVEKLLRQIEVIKEQQLEPIQLDENDDTTGEVQDLRAETERLMGENEQLRQQLEAAAKPPEPTAEVPADGAKRIEKLEKTVARKLELIRQRDRSIRELKRLLPKHKVESLKVVVEADPDLLGAALEPTGETGKWRKDLPPIDWQECRDALSELLSRMRLMRHDATAEQLYRFSNRLADDALTFWQEFQESGGGSREVTPLEQRSMLVDERWGNTVMDVASIAVEEEGA